MYATPAAASEQNHHTRPTRPPLRRWNDAPRLGPSRGWGPNHPGNHPGGPPRDERDRRGPPGWGERPGWDDRGGFRGRDDRDGRDFGGAGGGRRDERDGRFPGGNQYHERGMPPPMRDHGRGDRGEGYGRPQDHPGGWDRRDGPGGGNGPWGQNGMMPPHAGMQRSMSNGPGPMQQHPQHQHGGPHPARTAGMPPQRTMSEPVRMQPHGFQGPPQQRPFHVPLQPQNPHPHPQHPQQQQQHQQHPQQHPHPQHPQHQHLQQQHAQQHQHQPPPPHQQQQYGCAHPRPGPAGCGGAGGCGGAPPSALPSVGAGMPPAHGACGMLGCSAVALGGGGAVGFGPHGGVNSGVASPRAGNCGAAPSPRAGNCGAAPSPRAAGCGSAPSPRAAGCGSVGPACGGHVGTVGGSGGGVGGGGGAGGGVCGAAGGSVSAPATFPPSRQLTALELPMDPAERQLVLLENDARNIRHREASEAPLKLRILPFGAHPNKEPGPFLSISFGAWVGVNFALRRCFPRFATTAAATLVTQTKNPAPFVCPSLLVHGKGSTSL